MRAVAILVTLSVLVFSVLSCARPWRHPDGLGQDVLGKDSFSCRMIARERASVSYIEEERTEHQGYVDVRKVEKYRIDEAAMEDAFEECMASKGWRR